MAGQRKPTFTKWLSPEQFTWMKQAETAADTRMDGLSDQEKKFLKNRIKTFRKHGMSTRISAAHWKILHRIWKKIL